MEIAVVSGKGGTGKSCISAAFVSISKKIVLADCDVDAANMHILFQPEIIEEQVYVSGKKAVIDQAQCIRCGVCIDYCRFDAIAYHNSKVLIDEVSCDGCGLCYRVCPHRAINWLESNKSRMYSGNFRFGKMVFGHLAPGEENTGKLVNMVRQKARDIAKDISADIIIDGPPGIGCPVISTLTGVQHAVVVTEPTLSGINDLKRIIELCKGFNMRIWVIINKYDLNEQMSNQIFHFCHDNNIMLAGKIPFSPLVVEAMTQLKTVLEYAPHSDIAHDIKRMYKMIKNEKI